MNYQPINKLEVWRKLSSAKTIQIGTLAQNKQGIFFQYDNNYLSHSFNLSPFNLDFDNSLQLAPAKPHHNLHGAFSDSLPDGWGLLLMDRMFRQQGLLPSNITAMDRLAYIGDRAIGALQFHPVSPLTEQQTQTKYAISELGIKAQQLFDGDINEVLSALIHAGSSGGARPKAQIYLSPAEPSQCSTVYKPGYSPFIIKFTSVNLPLGHEEGLCEAVYLSLAQQAGIKVPAWRLFDAPKQSGSRKWLAVKRFDTPITIQGDEGRYHLQSVSALLDADYKMPSLDYEDLIKMSGMLCKSPAAAQEMFRRMIFNLFAVNQDDHSKNWAFLQYDNGQWQLAPFYDVTFSPSVYNEHSTAFCGHGKTPPLQTIQKMAAQANFSRWKDAQTIIQEVIEAIQGFDKKAKDLSVEQETRALIQKQLNTTYQQNKHLVT